MTNESSGHYYENWTPEIREKFIQTMDKYGLPTQHYEGM
jgi:hypothetical protein